MSLDSAIQMLSRRGYKLTPQRRMILEVLLENNQHRSAEEIFKEIQKEHPDVSFGTVYRNLNMLVEIGLVTQLDFKDGRYRFEICETHHHHLVCLDCGAAVEMPMCPFSSSVLKIANKNNFKVLCHNFEVYGYCQQCK